jgi:hypothetical protein
MSKSKLVKCYHVSPILNRKSILEKGLLTGDCDRMKYKNRLFFSIDENYLGFDYVSYFDIDVWSFYVEEHKILPDENADSPSHLCIEECISPEKLTLEFTECDEYEFESNINLIV